MIRRHMYIHVIYMHVRINVSGTFSFVAFYRMRPLMPHTVCCASQQASSAVSHSKHVCCMKQETCLLRDTAAMSAVCTCTYMYKYVHPYMCPPLLRHKTTILSRRKWGDMTPRLPRNLDLDTCFSPQAQTWTDLNNRLLLSIWGGLEGSGPIFQ